MEALVEMLNNANGKKVYGYLKKPVKAQVNSIVDEMARLPQVAECYEAWNRLRDEVECYYKDKPREHLPLSQQKEFRAVKNMVIQEAEHIRLGTVSFEDERMKDEVEEEKKAAVYTLEQFWDMGFAVAAHQLGKCWRDGLGVLPDGERAEMWFRRSAEAGNDFSQYALGKLLQSQRRIEEAVKWYEKAAAQGNQYTDYRLGKLYLEGVDVPKDVSKAAAHLTASANCGNPYAQYALGKLYLAGQDVKQDREAAWDWFYRSAEQGNEYAQFFLDHFEYQRKPSVLLCTTRLLYHMGQIFRENSVPPRDTVGHVDRKLRARIREKKIALGQNPNDHEEQQYGGWNMAMR